MGNFWSQPIRVEDIDNPQLITCRTINSALWFVNNKALEHRILGYLAKYIKKYKVKLYAFTLVGNHYHMIAMFPEGRRSEFFRDFNARVAEAVNQIVPEFLGGPLFERRFTPQPLLLDSDVENYFFYCALQPVSSGLCDKISDYMDYNSFKDASYGTIRRFKLFNYGKYNAAKRNKPNVRKQDFEEEHELQYERLPGHEEITNKDYNTRLLKELEKRRVLLVNKRKDKGKPFFGKENLRRVKPGSLPNHTKRDGIRPLVLTACREIRKQYLDWYFSIVAQYREAVDRYRKGYFNTLFPEGTFRPPGVCLNSC